MISRYLSYTIPLIRCYVVSSYQELSGDAQYAVIAPVCVTLRFKVHSVQMEQKITSTTPHTTVNTTANNV